MKKFFTDTLNFKTFLKNQKVEIFQKNQKIFKFSRFFEKFDNLIETTTNSNGQTKVTDNYFQNFFTGFSGF